MSLYMCGICNKNFRSFESLREHLIGLLPKAECARVFSTKGCNLCLTIFDSPNTLGMHQGRCQLPHPNGLLSGMANLGVYDELRIDNGQGRSLKVVSLACKMVGGGTDGTLDICARVCLTDVNDNIILYTYINPHMPVTAYWYARTGIRPEYLRDAMPMKHVQRKIQDFLCNAEPVWKIQSRGGRARILVGNGLDHDLHCLAIEYPSIMLRDKAKYPPLMKTTKQSDSLKYLTQPYLGYEIQTGVQDPYEDCVSKMRLSMRM